jgi:iron-sulfur cluster repair protein YtfE (RIC family)
MTAAPTRATSTAGPVDTRDMFVVHSGFRREFRLAPGLVRSVPAGDTARAAQVATHLGLVTDLLHHHHTNEDALVWPTLLARVPEQLAPIVELMEGHHAAVHDLLEQFPGAVRAWTAAAQAAPREALADLLDRLYAILDEHLTAEEQRLLPIAATYMSQEEWDQLGEQAPKMPLRQQTIVLGSMMYDGDPEVLAHMLSKAPWVVRALLPRFARRAYANYARALYGTPTP